MSSENRQKSSRISSRISSVCNQLKTLPDDGMTLDHASTETADKT